MRRLLAAAALVLAAAGCASSSARPASVRSDGTSRCVDTGMSSPFGNGNGDATDFWDQLAQCIPQAPHGPFAGCIRATYPLDDVSRMEVTLAGCWKRYAPLPSWLAQDIS